MRPTLNFVRIAVAVTLIAASEVGARAQTPNAATPVALLRVIVSADVLAGLTRRTVTVTREDGSSATYSGVDLGALLAKQGAPHGATLRGKDAADIALVTASDGYRVVFALAELDAALTDKVVVLADERDRKPLGADTGPYQIVVPDEKHHVRWIRNVRSIEIEKLP